MRKTKYRIIMDDKGRFFVQSYSVFWGWRSNVFTTHEDIMEPPGYIVSTVYFDSFESAKERLDKLKNETLYPPPKEVVVFEDCF